MVHVFYYLVLFAIPFSGNSHILLFALSLSLLFIFIHIISQSSSTFQQIWKILLRHGVARLGFHTRNCIIYLVSMCEVEMISVFVYFFSVWNLFSTYMCNLVYVMIVAICNSVIFLYHIFVALQCWCYCPWLQILCFSADEVHQIILSLCLCWRKLVYLYR